MGHDSRSDKDAKSVPGHGIDFGKVLERLGKLRKMELIVGFPRSAK